MVSDYSIRHDWPGSVAHWEFFGVDLLSEGGGTECTIRDSAHFSWYFSSQWGYDIEEGDMRGASLDVSMLFISDEAVEEYLVLEQCVRKARRRVGILDAPHKPLLENIDPVDSFIFLMYSFPNDSLVSGEYFL